MKPAAAAEAAFQALSKGDGEAAVLFERAIALDAGNPALILGEAEALMVAGHSDPAARLRGTVARNPNWAEGQAALASLLWELGDAEHYADHFRRALESDRNNAALWNAYLQTLSGIQDYAAAADAAAEARRLFDAPVLALIEATNRGMIGDDAAVEALIRAVPPSRERDEVEVRHRIRLRDYGAAVAIADRLIGTDDADLGSWAIAEVLWRRTGDRRWAWLAGEAQFIVRVELAYTREQLDALAVTLTRLHRQQRAPVGQSVRGGTQTRGRLFDRSEPEIAALHGALQAAVDAYRGQLPPADARHPLLRHRERELRADGGWSVRLTGTGLHVPHLHPAGVLSSAFYVRVPPLDPASREGWLELGRPPADLRMDLEPLASVEPVPGTLVLFPSYLYHGTRPFSGGERMSVAFDVA